MQDSIQPYRCDWCLKDPLYISYHDNEWGVPLYDNQQLFEFLILEGMQAGLSWLTVLRKREHMRTAFANFQPERLLKFSDSKLQQLMQNSNIIRNQRKILAVSTNAKAYLKLTERVGSFAEYIWQFVDGQSIQNSWETLKQVPVTIPQAKQMSKALRKEGFTFVGETICYAYMQAIGMVNDHLVGCFRYGEVGR